MQFYKWDTIIYICIYEVPSISFQTFFVQAFKNYRRLLKIHYVIAIHLIK